MKIDSVFDDFMTAAFPNVSPESAQYEDLKRTWYAATQATISAILKQVNNNQSEKDFVVYMTDIQTQIVNFINGIK